MWKPAAAERKPGAGVQQAEISTDRLLLRPFVPADAGAVRLLVDNYAVSSTTLNIPYPYLPGTAETWIGSHRRNWEFRSSATYAITLSESGLLLGAVTLTWVNRSLAELGYWIGEPHWDNGYCSEAVRALIGFAFERLEISRILAEHLCGNPASGRVMQKAGMSRVGSRRKKGRDGNPVEMEIYEIRKSARAMPDD